VVRVSGLFLYFGVGFNNFATGRDLPMADLAALVADGNGGRGPGGRPIRSHRELRRRPPAG